MANRFAATDPKRVLGGSSGSSELDPPRELDVHFRPKGSLNRAASSVTGEEAGDEENECDDQQPLQPLDEETRTTEEQGENEK